LAERATLENRRTVIHAAGRANGTRFHMIASIRDLI